MKNTIFSLAVMLAASTLFGQSRLDISASADYMHHSKLTGFALANDLVLPIRGRHSAVVGFELGFAEGNRNFERKKDGNSNVEFEGYYPDYFFLSGPTYLFDYPVNLKALTSTTYQLSLRAGYGLSGLFKNERFECVLGGYFTYVYKSYIAKTDYALQGSLGGGPIPIPYVIDLSYPFNLRYIDAGPYAQFSYRPFKNAKLPSLRFSYSQGFKRNSSWFCLGLNTSIRVGKAG